MINARDECPVDATLVTLNLQVEGSNPSRLTSLRSHLSRRVSAVALVKADLAARYQLRLPSQAKSAISPKLSSALSSGAESSKSGTVTAVRVNQFRRTRFLPGRSLIDAEQNEGLVEQITIVPH